MGVQKRARTQRWLDPGFDLATTYSHRTYRPTTIGAEAFHFRVRNGTGWFHLALVTRGQFQWQAFLLLELGLWGSESFSGISLIGLIGPIGLISSFLRPLPDIHMEIFPI